MFPLEAFQSTLGKVTGIFESLKIPFHLTGGVTSIAYGEPRMTQDVDIVIENEQSASVIDELIVQLNAKGFLFEESAVRNAIRSKRMFQLLDTQESLKLDIYPRQLVEGELTRSESREVFPGVFLPCASLVDAVISKLIWIDKGSHKNRRDVRQIHQRANQQQQQFVHSLAESMKLRDLLTEVLQESDEIE